MFGVLGVQRGLGSRLTRENCSGDVGQFERESVDIVAGMQISAVQCRAAQISAVQSVVTNKSSASPTVGQVCVHCSGLCPDGDKHKKTLCALVDAPGEGFRVPLQWSDERRARTVHMHSSLALASELRTHNG
jgi:hypothetical protein